MLEIKSAVVVVVFIILKHNNGLCGKLVYLYYFNTEASLPFTNFCVRVTPFACTLHARS